MAADVEFLRELSLAPGPSGFEEPVQEIVRRRLERTAVPQTDVLGNVAAEVNAEGHPHVVVEAHVDQIGLQVTCVDERGFVYFDKIGSVDPLLLPGRKMSIHSAAGPVTAVVGKRPTHMIPDDERGRAQAIHEQWLDIGADDREAALARVAIGDSITFAPDFVELSSGIVTGRAMDDRCGVYVAVRALEDYAAAPGAARLTAVSSVQEETRYMGALASARAMAPECVIVVDGDFTTDQPEVEPRRAGGLIELGGGPVLGRGGSSNPRLFALAVEVAAAAGVAVQVKAYPGDTETDAEVLQAAGAGVACLCVGLPMRYMHSPHEVAAVDDLEACVRLVVALVQRLGEVFAPGYFVPRP